MIDVREAVCTHKRVFGVKVMCFQRDRSFPSSKKVYSEISESVINKGLWIGLLNVKRPKNSKCKIIKRKW